MSATNRGGLTRSPNDFYETPRHAIEALAKELPFNARSSGLAIDAGCGNGAISGCLAPMYPAMDFQGIDIDPSLVSAAKSRSLDNATFEVSDFLRYRITRPRDEISLIAMNPPFKLARGFLERALDIAGPKTTIAFLINSTFLTGDFGAEEKARHGAIKDPAKKRKLGRHAWLQSLRYDVLLLSNRPSFTGDGGSDSAVYYWLLFGPGRGGCFFVSDRVYRKAV